MIKLMMAVVWLSGHVDHVELTGSKYETLRDCQAHVRQMTFTNHFNSGLTYHGSDLLKNNADAIVGGGFYCEVVR